VELSAVRQTPSGQGAVGQDAAEPAPPQASPRAVADRVERRVGAGSGRIPPSRVCRPVCREAPPGTAPAPTTASPGWSARPFRSDGARSSPARFWKAFRSTRPLIER